MNARTCFSYASFALLAGALLHFGGLLMGPDAIKFLGAPPDVVQSVADKTFYGPAITLAIAALLGGLAWLVWRTRPPRVSGKIVRYTLVAFATIFTLRGMLTFLFVPAVMSGTVEPDPIKFWFHVGAGLFVLSIGFALTWGLVKTAGMKP